MVENAGKIIWLAGASGRVGAQVLERLLQAPEPGRVLAISRRPLSREHPRLANRILPFGQLEAQLRGQACDAALCCVAASADVLGFARAARTAGARRFVIVSCQAADAAERQALDDIATLGFDSLTILVPGPLLGLRRGAGVPELLAMLLAAALRPVQVGARQGRRAIAASCVAAAAVAAARSNRRGATRHEYSGIVALSRTRPGT